MYKPQYLNTEMIVEEYCYYGSNENDVEKSITVIPLGYKKKPPKRINKKSGRRFSGK